MLREVWLFLGVFEVEILPGRLCVGTARRERSSERARDLRADAACIFWRGATHSLCLERAGERVVLATLTHIVRPQSSDKELARQSKADRARPTLAAVGPVRTKKSLETDSWGAKRERRTGQEAGTGASNGNLATQKPSERGIKKQAEAIGRQAGRRERGREDKAHMTH